MKATTTIEAIMLRKLNAIVLCLNKSFGIAIDNIHIRVYDKRDEYNIYTEEVNISIYSKEHKENCND